MRPPLKYEAITVSTTAIALNPPTSDWVDYTIISVETNPVRWRDDGTNPTSSEGHPDVAGARIYYEGDPKKIKFIRSGAADATLRVTYYGKN